MAFYITAGTLGALVGVNIAAYLLKLDVFSNPVMGNHIAEAVMLLSVIGLIYDLIPRKVKFNPLWIAVIAGLFGFVWEAFTFLAFSSTSALMMIELQWLKYGIPTSFLIGLPILFISNIIRKERKVLDFDVTGINGRLLCFVISLIIAALIFKFMMINDIFGLWCNYIGVCQ